MKILTVKTLQKIQFPFISLFILSLISITCKNSTESDLEDFRQIDTQINVQGTTMKYSLAVPNSYKNQTASPLILALHYGGQITSNYGQDFLTSIIAPALKDLNAFMVSPTVPVKSGWTHPTSKKCVLALIDTLKKRYNIAEDKIVITGFSLGAIGTWDLIADYSHLFSAAIPVSGKPERPVTHLINDIPIYVIHSRNDEIFPFEDVEQLVIDLKNKGVQIEFMALNGVSHYSSASFISPLSQTVNWVRTIWSE